MHRALTSGQSLWPPIYLCARDLPMHLLLPLQLPPPLLLLLLVVIICHRTVRRQPRPQARTMLLSKAVLAARMVGEQCHLDHPSPELPFLPKRVENPRPLAASLIRAFIFNQSRQLFASQPAPVVLELTAFEHNHGQLVEELAEQVP